MVVRSGRDQWIPMPQSSPWDNASGELRSKMEYLIPAYLLVLVSEGRHKKQGEITC